MVIKKIVKFFWFIHTITFEITIVMPTSFCSMNKWSTEAQLPRRVSLLKFFGYRSITIQSRSSPGSSQVKSEKLAHSRNTLATLARGVGAAREVGHGPSHTL
jgi:hypothetical protein